MNLTIKPYETANATLHANGELKMRGKIRFEKASNANEWSTRIYNCALFCKVAKSIYYNFTEIRKQYHIKYSTSLFYGSFCWSHIDLKNYNITINLANKFVYGHGRDLIIGRDLIDQRVDFHVQVENEFSSLLNSMKYDLPSDRYNSIMENLKFLTDATTK